MKIRSIVFTLLIVVFAGSVIGEEYRRLPVSVYRDKMKAGWVGQIAGVAWGAPTEFKWKDEIVPEDKVPVWTPEMINNAFGQDDLYVEMTFLKTLEDYGFDCTSKQAGIDFANSRYALWCANRAGRNNLRAGIAPPDSGHPQFNRCPNDIDYQIEADYSGLIAPGLPNTVIALGDKFGRMMNYSDGIYGGMFVGGMYAEAFFTDDLEKIVAAGLACIPAKSQYAEMVRDMVKWYKEDPNDWERTWRLCQRKYREDPAYQKCSNGGIDVKINGAYILLGLLYGKGDPDRTIVISLRGGQDSDCNPSNSGGVLFTTLGFSKLPERFSGRLDSGKVFSYTAYNFPALLDACEKLARAAIVRAGGRIEKDEKGGDVFVIPVRRAEPLPLELSWAPGPVAHSRYTEEEMQKIKVKTFGFEQIQKGIDKYFPDWKVSQCGKDMEPGVRDYRDCPHALVTHPLDRNTPCLLTREYKVPKTGKTTLRLRVAAHGPKFDWELIVRVNGSEQFRDVIGGSGKYAATWNEIEVDLTKFAGETIHLELANAANGWLCEAGYWSVIELTTK